LRKKFLAEEESVTVQRAWRYRYQFPLEEAVKYILLIT